MNTYHKYCPHVYLAKCEEEYGKGDIITVTTRNGKEHECEVHTIAETPYIDFIQRDQSL